MHHFVKDDPKKVDPAYLVRCDRSKNFSTRQLLRTGRQQRVECATAPARPQPRRVRAFVRFGLAGLGRYVGHEGPPRELVVRGSAPRHVKPPDFDLECEVVAAIISQEGTGAH